MGGGFHAGRVVGVHEPDQFATALRRLGKVLVHHLAEYGSGTVVQAAQELDL